MTKSEMAKLKAECGAGYFPENGNTASGWTTAQPRRSDSRRNPVNNPDNRKDYRMTGTEELEKMKSEILEAKKAQLLELEDAYRKALAKFRELEDKIEKTRKGALKKGYPNDSRLRHGHGPHPGAGMRA